MSHILICSHAYYGAGTCIEMHWPISRPLVAGSSIWNGCDRVSAKELRLVWAWVVGGLTEWSPAKSHRRNCAMRLRPATWWMDCPMMRKRSRYLNRKHAFCKWTSGTSSIRSCKPPNDHLFTYFGLYVNIAFSSSSIDLIGWSKAVSMTSQRRFSWKYIKQDENQNNLKRNYNIPL